LDQAVADDLDQAVGHLLKGHTAESLEDLIQHQGYLWDTIGFLERMGLQMYRARISEVLASINAFMVLASVQRVKPELAQVLGDQAGLRWLRDQLADLRGQVSG
jgi:hypothetical protein